MHSSDNELLRYLQDSTHVRKDALETAFADAQKRDISFAEALIEQNIFSVDELRRFVAHMLGVPFVKLRGHEIPLEAMELIPEPVSREHNIVAYANSNDSVEVALLDIEDLQHVDAAALGRRVLPRLTDVASMKSVLLQYQRYLRTRFGEHIAHEASLLSEPENTDSGALLKAAQQVPAGKLVDMLLRHAQVSRASDIHLQKSEQGFMVRYRIHGRLRDTMVLPHSAAASVILRLKLLGQVPLTTMVPREGRFELHSEHGKAQVSVSSIATATGERIVLHIVPDLQGRDGYSLQALGFTGESLEVAHSLLKQSSGLVLVAGAHGSGKTTALYALADLLCAGERSVVVVEDTHECKLKGVSQVRSNDQLGLTLAGCLRAALRQDPDVVVLSEITNAEVAEVALRAANRGVLVVAGFVARDVVRALVKLQELVSGELLAATFRGGVGVSVLKRLCEEHGSRAMSRADLDSTGFTTDPARVLATLKEHGVIDVRMSWKEVCFGEAHGCDKCDAGYRGCVGAQQGLLASDTFAGLLRSNVSYDALLSQARVEGMLTLEEDALCKAVQNFTSVEEVLRLVERSS